MKKNVRKRKFIQYRKDIDRVRVVHNKVLFIIIIVMLFVLAGLLYYANYLDIKVSKSQKCSIDSDCVKVDLKCCPCQSSGEEQCVLKSEEGEYLDLLKDCPVNRQSGCPEVYNCNINECSCINGECNLE